MADQSQSVSLVFSIAPKSNMIDATGALLRERVEITAQSIEQGMIFGKADPTRIDTLRGLSEFAAIECDHGEPIEQPYAVVTLWGWSSSIRTAARKERRPRRLP